MSDDLDVRPIDLLDPQQEAAEEEVWDADRLRESFERTLASGRRVVESVARHRPSYVVEGYGREWQKQTGSGE